MVFAEDAKNVLKNNEHQKWLADNPLNAEKRGIHHSLVHKNNNSNKQLLAIEDSPNKGGKTKRRKAGKKNKSKRVRFMSRRNRRR